MSQVFITVCQQSIWDFGCGQHLLFCKSWLDLLSSLILAQFGQYVPHFHFFLFGFPLHLLHQFSICFCSSFSFCTPRWGICKNALLGKYFSEILILKSYESVSELFLKFDKKRPSEKNVSQKYSNWFDSSCQCNLRFHCSKVGCCNLQWVGSIEMHLDEMFLWENVLNLESKKIEHAVQHYQKNYDTHTQTYLTICYHKDQRLRRAYYSQNRF